jgi:hypothetical protein
MSAHASLKAFHSLFVFLSRIWELIWLMNKEMISVLPLSKLFCAPLLPHRSKISTGHLQHLWNRQKDSPEKVFVHSLFGAFFLSTEGMQTVLLPALLYYRIGATLVRGGTEHLFQLQCLTGSQRFDNKKH